MSELPRGTVTFLFTDIEESTPLLRRLGAGYAEVLSAHRRILRAACAEHGGHEIDAAGDGTFFAFATAHAALGAAVDGQAAVASHPWPEAGGIRVRMGLHTAEPTLSDGAYVGLGVHRAARVCAAAAGGQILVSGATRSVLVERGDPGLTLRDVGLRPLKGLGRPEHLYEVSTADRQARDGSRRGRAVRVGRVRLGAVATLAVLAFGAGVLTSLAARSSTASAVPPVAADAVGAIDPATNRVHHQIPVGAAPGRLATGAGALWVANTDDDSVSRVDLRTGTAGRPIPVGHGPDGIAVGAGFVWVADGPDGFVKRIDPALGRVVGTTRVGNGPADVLVAAGMVWVANTDDRTISRIDPATGRRAGPPLDVPASGLAYGAGAVWATDRFAGVVRGLDPHTGGVTAAISVGHGPTAVIVSADAVWVANTLDDTVSRIDPRRAAVTAAVPVGRGPVALTAAAGSIWAASESDGTIARLDPANGRVLHTVPVGRRPQGLAPAAGDIWVGVRAAGAGHRGGTLTIVGHGTSRSGLDPAFSYSTDTSAILETVGEGLTALERVGGSAGTQIVPNLARALPTAVNGGRTYTFSLRPGIRYSTGQPVRATDFRHGFERAFALGAGSPTWALFDRLPGRAACARSPRNCDLAPAIETDDRAGTVTFHLTAPDPEFLAKLAGPWAFPAPPGTRPAPALVPGAGPYRIARFRARHEIVLERDRYFRSWSQAAAPAGYPDRIVIRLDLPISAVEDGRADLVGRTWVGDALVARLPDLRRRFPRQIRLTPLPATIFLSLNTRVPPFNDPRVRRALNEAVDRTEAVRLGGGIDAARPTCQVLPFDFPAFRPYCPYRHDLAAAKAAVAASHTAGMPVTVWTNSQLAPFAREAVRALDALGYRTRVRRRDDDMFQYANDSRNRAQIATWVWLADYPAASDFFLTTLRCRAFVPASPDNPNSAEFCDPRIDARIDAAAALQRTNPGRADLAWARADRAVVDAAPWVPLINPRDIAFISPRVGNFQDPPAGAGVLIDQLWVR